MNEQQKQAIIDSGKEYFRSTIIPNHIKNLEKLSLGNFDVNPFLINYLAAFLCGNTKPESLAKALVYPRILGSSVTTTFGMSIQIFISKLSQITGGASGIDGIILPINRSVSVNSTVYKCASGALSHIKIVEVVNLATSITKLKDMGYFIYSAAMDGKEYKQIDYANKVCLVIGNEGSGISRLVRENSDEIISIEMKGEINSLNASVAAGILIYGIEV